jgi:hypothetical protein
MDSLYFKTCTQAEYNSASSGKPLAGYISYCGSSCPAWIKLGQEVEDMKKHKDNKTEYRKFVRCELLDSRDIEVAVEDISTKVIGRYTIWIYY